MEHPRNQQTHFNPNDQGLLGNPQRPYEPPRQGDGVAPSETLTEGGGNINFQKNQYRAPPTPLLSVERTLQKIPQPQRTTSNSCIRLPEEANQFLMKSEMILLLLVYQGVDSENPYSFMRDFEDVCSAFLSKGSLLHIICMVLFPLSLKEKAKIWFHSLTPNSIFTWENMRNEFLDNSSLSHALMHSCKQSKTFLKNRVNLLLLYGKDIRTSSTLSSSWFGCWTNCCIFSPGTFPK